MPSRMPKAFGWSLPARARHTSAESAGSSPQKPPGAQPGAPVLNPARQCSTRRSPGAQPGAPVPFRISPLRPRCSPLRPVSVIEGINETGRRESVSVIEGINETGRRESVSVIEGISAGLSAGLSTVTAAEAAEAAPACIGQPSKVAWESAAGELGPDAVLDWTYDVCALDTAANGHCLVSACCMQPMTACDCLMSACRTPHGVHADCLLSAC